MTPEDELRDRLHGLAEAAGRPSADGPGLARRIAQDTADRRRSRRNVLVGVGCLVLLGITVPQLADTGSEGAVPASGPVSAPASGLAGGASAGPGDADIFGQRTRGSLAGDRTFVDGVRALSWIPEPPPPAEDGMTYYLPAPPLETRSVAFAGEVSGERWAMVVGWASDLPPDVPALPPGDRPPDQLVAAWFTGPHDAGAGEMTLRSSPTGIAPDWPMAVTDPRTGAVVVVAAPGDVVEVSERPQIDADGSTTRTWREVDTVDGIAITRVPPSLWPYDASTSYRVLRDGLTEARDMPWSFFSDQPSIPLPIEYPRGRPSENGEQAAQSTAQNMLAELGLSPAQVEITAQWVGGVPAHDAGDAGQAAVVTITLPSGAVAVEGQVLLPGQPDAAMSGAFCGQAILPAGPPADRRVQAMACEFFDYATGGPVGGTLVVVGPPEVALIRTYAGDRTFLTEHAAVEGILVVPLPVGTDTVEAVTAGGVTLGRVELLGHAVDFGD
jgi:hypothetical protein